MPDSDSEHSGSEPVNSKSDRGKLQVRALLDGSHKRLGHSFEYAINFFIIVSIATISLETVEPLHSRYSTLFYIAEVTVVLVFGIEYALRIWSARDRTRYIFSFWGIVDFLAFVPAAMQIFGTSPALRALRLIRLLKLTRASGALDVLGQALCRVRHEMVAMIMLGAITLYISAVGIYIFERDAQPEVFGSIPQAVWWAAVTLTTVGYGDVYPITAAGRAFTLIVLTLGLGVVAVPTALLSASLVNVIRERSEQARAQKANDKPSEQQGTDPD